MYIRKYLKVLTNHRITWGTCVAGYCVAIHKLIPSHNWVSLLPVPNLSLFYRHFWNYSYSNDHQRVDRTWLRWVDFDSVDFITHVTDQSEFPADALSVIKTWSLHYPPMMEDGVAPEGGRASGGSIRGRWRCGKLTYKFQHVPGERQFSSRSI